MQLEKLDIVLYPRAPWAAIDLGFAMARRWWGPMVACWCLTALPLFVILHVLFFKWLWLVPLVFWWLKPVYEQMPLMFLSRAVFGQTPTLREIAREWRASRRQLLPNLTWRRLSHSRSFSAPVAQLEGLDGVARRRRLEVLNDGNSARAWLTIVAAHIEAVFYGSLILVGYLLLPEELQLREWFTDNETLTGLASNVFYCMAIAAVAPFYIAGGFSLYLHRRTQLEGWDIELEFRRMRERRPRRNPAAAVVAALLAVVMVSALSPAPDARAAEAMPAKEESKQWITEVLAHEDFGKKVKDYEWRFKRGDMKMNRKVNVPSLWQLLVARIGEVLLWIGAVVAVVYLLYRTPRWLARLRRAGPAASATVPPSVLFGLDVRADSLPEDVAAAALALCERGEARAALSLLYRASLAVLMTRDGIEFRAGSTEGECVTLVQRRRQDAVATFFADITRRWQSMAYGHFDVPRDELDRLCHNWAKHFGAAS